MNNLLSEEIKVVSQASADIDTSDVSSTVYQDVSNFRRAYIRVETVTNLTVGKILTLTPKQATAAGGTSAKALGSAVTFTATGTGKGFVGVDIDVSKMDTKNGFTFLGWTVGSDLGSAVVASVATVLGEPNYKPVV